MKGIYDTKKAGSYIDPAFFVNVLISLVSKEMDRKKSTLFSWVTKIVRLCKDLKVKRIASFCEDIV